ncbi:MAG: methyl-accepting chemotaxis protein [Candidatus Kariarchaeaceae archaeon]|jgi:methyl-accepting chemotaxis protein
MAGLGVIFNIKFRLVLIIIITASALYFQGTLITDSQETQLDIEDAGNDYIDFDAGILLDISELKYIGEQLVRTQSENIIKRILFNTEDFVLGSQLGDYNDKINVIIDKLAVRAENNYKINVNQSNLFNLDLVDPSLLDELETIIGTGLYDVYDTAQNLESGLADEIQTIDENAEEFRDLYEGNTTQFNLDYDVFTNSSIETLHSLFDSAIHRLNITNVPSIQNELNQSSTMRAVLGIGIAESVNESVTLTYVFNTRHEFEEIHELVDEIVAAWYNFVKEMAFRDETVVDGLDQALSEFNTTLVTERDEIFEEIEELDGNVLDNEQTNLTLIENFINFNFFPAVDNMIVLMQNVYISLTNMLGLLDNEFSTVVDNTNADVEDIRFTIEFENEQFLTLFNEIKEDVRTNFNTIILFTSAILIAGILLLLLLVALQLTRSLRGTSKDYIQLSQGNLAKLKRGRYASSEFGNMQRGFDAMVGNLRNILETLQVTSERLAGIAEELAAGAQEASASVNEVAETVREFSAGSSEQNLLLNRVSQKLDDHLVDVEEAANRIGETSNFVLKVAKRTNILGLNASIEAAKAGKFGLGFNVVAEEVRNLSEDTRASATQIADLIEEVEYNIKSTVEEMQKEVNISKEVAENTAAGSEQANAATSEQVIMLKEISTTSNDLSLLAQELREIIHRFTLE